MNGPGFGLTIDVRAPVSLASLGGVAVGLGVVATAAGLVSRPRWPDRR